VSARDRILGRVRAAMLGRDPVPHPGDFAEWRPSGTEEASAIDGFQRLFEAAGGSVVRAEDERRAARWLRDFTSDFRTAASGESVPEALRPHLAPAPADRAELGVSMARAAVAETGSLVMDARDGRRSQLLVPTHVVFVRAEDLFHTLRAALAVLRADLPSAIGLHSGPSKSADIGQIMVKGVHGPGRVVAVVIGRDPGKASAPQG
jgi:L-lactate dehydrogenase complex protein LldG